MINKSNKILIIILIVVGIILLSIITFLRLSTTKGPTTIPLYPPSNTDSVREKYIPVQTNISNLSSTVPDDVAQKEKDKLTEFLPITIKNHQTSSGITTNMNIFSIASDPSQMIHLEIYGVNYYLSDAKNDNPHAIAFTESFSYIKQLLLGKGININNLQVIYGNRDYIQNTSENWIKAFNLLP